MSTINPEYWLTTWSQSQKGLGLFPINDNNHTVQYIIPINHKGTRVRLSLGNYYSKESLIISGISISKSEKGPFVKLRVNNKEEIILKENEVIKTDDIDFVVKADELLYVRIYYPVQPEAQRSVSGNTLGVDPKRFVFGDYTETDQHDIDYNYVDEFLNDEYAVKFSHEFEKFKQRYTMTIQGVDVYIDKIAHTIVAFGDSITEQNHWVNPLKKEILKSSQNNYSLVNAGISGNRLLKKIDHLPNRAQYFGFSGLERFEHDVFLVNDNVSTVIISLGVNDLHQPGTDSFFSIRELPTFDEMVDGYNQLISICKKHKVKVILGTLSPFIGYTKDVKNKEKEDLRQKINFWIRNNTELDNFYDFDKVLKSPENKELLNPLYDSGDKLHPSSIGGEEMVKVIDIEELINE